jgi:hypothetical protein
LFRGVDIAANITVLDAGPPQLYTENEQVLGNWFVKAVLADYDFTYTDQEVA